MPNDIRGKKRKLKVYKKDDLEAAFVAVKEGKMSIRDASRKFNVLRTTLGNHIMEQHGTTSGWKPELSAEEEEMIVESVKLLGVWWFPFTSTDLATLSRFISTRKGPSRDSSTICLGTDSWQDSWAAMQSFSSG
jgi:hypothetical protein